MQLKLDCIFVEILDYTKYKLNVYGVVQSPNLVSYVCVVVHCIQLPWLSKVYPDWHNEHFIVLLRLIQ